MWHMALGNNKMDYAKHDSRLAEYGGVVLQRFEIIKVCIEMQWFCSKILFFLYLVNKTNLPCCCVANNKEYNTATG